MKFLYRLHDLIPSKSAVTSRIFVKPTKVIASSRCSELYTGPKEKATRLTPKIRIPDFKDTSTIYRNRNWLQLFRAFVVFNLCSWNFLVNNQLKILSWSRRLFGLRMFRAMMRMTIYGQFMAGENENEVLDVARHNAESGLYAMFSYTASEAHGHAKEAEGITSQNNIYVKNYSAIMEGLHMASMAKDFSYISPQLATKLTFFIKSQVLFNFNALLTHQKVLLAAILHGPDKQRSKDLRDYLNTVLSNSMDTYSGTGMVLPKGESIDFDIATWETNLPFNLQLSHSTEFLDLIKNLSSPAIHPTLSGSDEKELLNLWEKLITLGKYSSEAGVVLILDAEQTYLQPAIECFTLDLMRKYNTDRPVIHNTYQCYLTRTHDIVTRDLKLANREGFCLGLKVVRGAYLVEERHRADSMGYDDPVNLNYDATTDMYEQVATTLLQKLNSLGHRRIHVTFATHNEETVKFVLHRMNDLEMTLEDKNVAFAQLLGMRDHISFSLGAAHIPSAKLISYGVIQEGIMWLSRRVLENTQLSETAKLERHLLQKEIKRRIIS